MNNWFENEKKLVEQELKTDTTMDNPFPDDVPCDGDCPVTTAIGLIGGKWKIMIIWQLRNRTKRFSELLRLIKGVNKKMLTQQLRELERDGLINRKVYPVVPPKVEYSLTETGLSLQPVIDTISKWGRAYLKNNGYDITHKC
jgi:DNA-binding HxlR family transcriptional regulator